MGLLRLGSGIKVFISSNRIIVGYSIIRRSSWIRIFVN